MLKNMLQYVTYLLSTHLIHASSCAESPNSKAAVARLHQFIIRPFFLFLCLFSKLCSVLPAQGTSNLQ